MRKTTMSLSPILASLAALGAGAEDARIAADAFGGGLRGTRNRTRHSPTKTAGGNDHKRRRARRKRQRQARKIQRANR